jgi:ankyrin repeat protein
LSKPLRLGETVFANQYNFPQQLHLEQSKNISISASQNSQDIQRFIESELERPITKKLLLDGKVSSKLRGKIVRVLNQGAQGMFRWVALSLEVLRQIKFKKDFENALGQLPPTLSELYDKIYDQIENTETHGRTVATMTLKWLLCAQRLLSVRELIAAISMSPEDEAQSLSDTGADSSHERDSSSETDSEDESDSISQSDIIRLCHNMVIIDSELDAFRFAHQSVREYLQSRTEYTAGELHAFAMKRCLDVYLIGARSNSITTNKVYQEDLLKQYSKFYWPAHYKAAEGHMSVALKKKVLPFFLQGAMTSSPYATWAEDIASTYSIGHEINELLGLDWQDRLGYQLLSAACSPPTALSAACTFGLLSLTDEFDRVSPAEWNQRPQLDSGVYSLLHIAAKECQEQMVRWLLSKGVDLNPEDKLGETPLTLAAGCGHKAVVKLLLEKGADLESNNRDGRTPLSWAAEKGHKAVVELLLKKGADLESNDRDGRTPLSWAAGNGHEEAVELLLEKRADLESKDQYDRTPLSWAARNEHKMVVELLLEKGAYLQSKGRNYDNVQLLIAAQYGHEVVVKLLLEKGADLKSKDQYGQTPLYWAVEKGHEAVVELLLEKGADLESKDQDRRTPLLRAAQNGGKALVKLLLEKGADLESYDQYGQTPLLLAAEKGHKAVVELLLEKGADLESNDRFRRTSLSWAAGNGHEVVVELLLEKGADLESKDEDGRTPLLLAAKDGYEVVVKLLLKKGANLELNDQVGQTSLLWAAENGYEVVVKLLLEKGADLESKDQYGQTPLLLAAEKGHKAVVELLLEKARRLRVE